MSIVRDRIWDEMPHLKRYALSLARNTSVAEDLVQDCILTAIDRADQYRPDRPLRPWLFAILRNNFLNLLRRRKHGPLVDEDAARDYNPAVSGNQEASVQLGELQSALDRLSLDHKAIIVKVAVEGFSYEEAAEILAIPVGTVRSRLARARLALQHELLRPRPVFSGDSQSATRKHLEEGREIV